jgi:thymidylate synthase
MVKIKYLFLDFDGTVRNTIADPTPNNPNDRRMVVSAWNPLVLDQQALPPCHILWQVVVRGNHLDLVWFQRSSDFFIGIPFNVASYGLLLSLLAKQFGYKAGILTGFSGDSHIYNNHFEQVEELISREPYPLPTLKISGKFKDVREFDHNMVSLEGYKYHPAIKAPIAV